jgi:diguanylate cyclase (GGDEF)-like protein
MTWGWSLLALVGGIAFGCVLGWGLARRAHHERRVPPLDLAHALDLIRRAHGARAAWMVGLADRDIEVREEQAPATALRRGVALVQLASGDGRTHTAREPEGTFVAAGDFPYGAGVLLPPGSEYAGAGELIQDLRRVLATMRLAEQQATGRDMRVATQVAIATSGAHTLDAIAKAAAELSQHLTGRGSVVVIQDPATRRVQIRAASQAADKRLLGLALAADAPVSRAIEGAIPVVTHGMEDIFGAGVPERRRQDRAGTAHPLLDGHMRVGALVVLGPPLDPDGHVTAQLARLVTELGPRVAAARAVHEAEQRAVRDPLTGLCNLRDFERALQRFRLDQPTTGGSASLVYVDLDRFKQLNDTLGHPAGDAALRHVATLLEHEIRDGDLVARIGGEEFAVWLPRTPLAEAWEVAERVRRALEQTPWLWNGTPRRLTASCGVATYPDHVRDFDNLRQAADAALYRAKQEGRNRVVMASRAVAAS